MQAQSGDDEFDHPAGVVAGVVVSADTEIADTTQQLVSVQVGANLARGGRGVEQLGEDWHHAVEEVGVQRFDTAVPANRARLDAVEQLARLADEADLSMIQLALGFVTAHPAVTSAIIGPRTLAHLHSQLAAAGTVLLADVLDAIDAIVAPGLDLAAHEKNDTPPALLDPAQRRR